MNALKLIFAIGLPVVLCGCQPSPAPAESTVSTKSSSTDNEIRELVRLALISHAKAQKSAEVEFSSLAIDGLGVGQAAGTMHAQNELGVFLAHKFDVTLLVKDKPRIAKIIINEKTIEKDAELLSEIEDIQARAKLAEKTASASDVSIENVTYKRRATGGAQYAVSVKNNGTKPFLHAKVFVQCYDSGELIADGEIFLTAASEVEPGQLATMTGTVSGVERLGYDMPESVRITGSPR